MPEPEFFILLIVAGAIFAVCSGIAFVLYTSGLRKNSKALKIIGIVVLIPGLVIFLPVLFLLVLWIWYWVFGEKSTPPNSQNPPPAMTESANEPH